eukprot:6475490-Amphidinium_carterae.1
MTTCSPYSRPVSKTAPPKQALPRAYVRSMSSWIGVVLSHLILHLGPRKDILFWTLPHTHVRLPPACA